MYRCTDCGKKFNRIKKTSEEENKTAFSESCPFCGSENTEKAEKMYCRCCGRVLPENRKDYCSATCRKRGAVIYENQRKRYHALKSSPIFSLVREIDAYNREHGTNLSYGEYVARVLPQKSKEIEKSGKRRKGAVSQKLSGAVCKNSTA